MENELLQGNLEAFEQSDRASQAIEISGVDPTAKNPMREAYLEKKKLATLSHVMEGQGEEKFGTFTKLAGTRHQIGSMIRPAAEYEMELLDITRRNQQSKARFKSKYGF